MQLIFATNNKHKLAEIRDMLRGRFELSGLADIGFSGDIPENEKTLEGNALLKARAVYEFLRSGSGMARPVACFADDTGLEVEALNGAPGVYSARYSGEQFSSDKERSESNIRKLLKELDGKPNNKARFRTVIAYINDGKEMLFDGIVNGTIIREKKGDEGFGYDPVFVPDGYSKTFAEMTMQEKSHISHRSRAFKKLTDYLFEK